MLILVHSRAPELLRSTAGFSEFTESDVQKCDVYSFAIILFEIHSRNGPFGKTSLTPREVCVKLYPLKLTDHKAKTFLAGFTSGCTYEPWTPANI